MILVVADLGHPSCADLSGRWLGVDRAAVKRSTPGGNPGLNDAISESVSVALS